MRASLVSSLLLLLTSFVSTGAALEALVNSPCAVQCGNYLGGTSGSDIVCPDSSYTSTLAGQTFTTCIACQLGSTYVDPDTKQTDLQWGLYNIRYAISYCLFGFPNNTAIGDTPCITSTACGPLQGAIELNALAPNESAYSYCHTMLGSPSVAKCSACLQEQTDEFYLKNFLTALNAGCIQQPTPGKTIAIQGSVFSTTSVNITTPTATPRGSYVPSSGLSLGAKVGIAVGAFVLILVMLGFCTIWNGKRRRRAILRKVQEESGYDDWRKKHQFTPENALRGPSFAPRDAPPMNSNSYFDSPDSQRPLHPWAAKPGEDESPVSTFGEKAYFSPYTSNYSSPVSGSDQIPPVGREWPVERKTDLHGPIDVGRDWMIDRKESVASGSGGDRVRSRSRDKKEKQRDGGRYEMQNVPIVLMHPGHGRGPSTGSVALTEEDAMRGAAL